LGQGPPSASTDDLQALVRLLMDTCRSTAKSAHTRELHPGAPPVCSTMDFDREWIVPLERGDARILVRHGGRPMVCYAAMLQIFREGTGRRFG
jgi:hypothetical protein